MDNGQFTIPDHAPSAELTQDLESAFDPRDVKMMNEMDPYSGEKQTERNLDMYRSTATVENLPKKSPVDLARAAVNRVLKSRYV